MIYLHQLTKKWFRYFMRVLYSRNFASAKFLENKPLQKFPNIQFFIQPTCISDSRVFNVAALINWNSPLQFSRMSYDLSESKPVQLLDL